MKEPYIPERELKKAVRATRTRLCLWLVCQHPTRERRTYRETQGNEVDRMISERVLLFIVVFILGMLFALYLQPLLVHAAKEAYMLMYISGSACEA